MAALRIWRGRLPGLLLALAALAALHGAASAREPDLQALQAEVTRLAQQGKYAEATETAERLLRLAERRFGPDNAAVGQCLYNLAFLYQQQGRLADAEPLYERALPIFEKAVGRNHAVVATVLNNLGALYRDQSRHREAAPLLERSLAIREKALGADNLEVSQSLCNLALLYVAQSRYAQAEPLYKRCIAIREKALGPADPVVAQTLHDLALVYQNQKRNAEAEPLYKRSLAIREKALGPDHLDVAWSLNNLALIYQAQRRLVDAEQLITRALAIREKVLGPDHADVGNALHILAHLHTLRGRYADAEELYKRSLDIRIKTLGPEHADVGATLNNLADLYRTKGRYHEAEPLYKRSLAILSKALGSDHSDIATALQSLASLYQSQGRYADAEPILKRSLAIRQKTLGPEHAEIGDTILVLANIYQLQGRYAEAETLYKRSRAIFEKALGPEHAYVATALNNMAALYLEQANYAEAERLHKRSLAIREKTLGPEHSDVGASLLNLANLYQLQARFSDAERFYKRSLDVLVKSQGAEHPDVAHCLNALATLYETQRRFSEAEPLFKRSLAIREKALGPSHPDVGASLHNLGHLYVQQGRYDGAEPLFERAVSTLEAALGREHRDVGHVLETLATMRWVRGRNDEARSLYERANGIFEKSMGAESPYVAAGVNELAGLYFDQKDWPKAVELLERGTSILVRRARPGTESSLGRTLTGEGKSEVMRSVIAFTALVRAYHRLSGNDKAREPELAAKAFVTAERARESEAAASLAQMAARRARGETELGQIVRERQDLYAEWQARDKLLSKALSQPPERRVAKAEEELRNRLGEIGARIGEIDKKLTDQFPDYAALANPRPLSIDEAQAELAPGEALLLIVDLPELEPTPGMKMAPEETFVWAVTKTASRWVRSDLGTNALAERVEALRCGLDASGWQGDGGARCTRALGGTGRGPDGALPFDVAAAHEVYKALFGGIEDLIKDKHLLIVPSGALTSLPFQVLVTDAMRVRPLASNGGASHDALEARGLTPSDYATTAWLVRDHALTVLPSVASLAALRRSAKVSAAAEPFIGFGDPLLTRQCASAIIPDKCPDEDIEVASAAHSLTRSGGALEAAGDYFRGGLADVAAVKSRLCPLPDTAHELGCVAKSLGAGSRSLVLGKEMTETAVKTMPLDHYRVVHFATHGLLAGETEALAKAQAEPALVFSPPETATEEDDGLLTASEVAGLKLDADWVVMSACNTAGPAAGGQERRGEPGAEALSGLAKAFFYAGARALLVSHWPVNSYAATMLTSRTFAEMKKDPGIGRSEAFRRSMLALMSDKDRPWAAHPSVWAPFVVVGEGGAGR